MDHESIRVVHVYLCKCIINMCVHVYVGGVCVKRDIREARKHVTQLMDNALSCRNFTVM